MTQEQGFDWLSLDEDEKVLWDGEPLMKSIYPALAVGIPFSLVGIGIPIVVGAYLNIKNTDFVVTTQGLYVKRGVLSRSVQKIGFDKVQNISFSQGLFGTKFGYGNIEVSTAGGSGVEMRFRSIEEPKQVQELINKHIKKDKEGASDSVSENDILMEILKELRETRKSVERLEKGL